VAQDWRRLRKLADRYEATLRRQVLAVLDDLVKALSVAEVERALRSGRPLEVERLIRRVPVAFRKAQRTLTEVTVKAAQMSQVDRAAFTAINARAIAAAEQQAARLVTEISQDARTGLQSFITRSVRRGVDVRDMRDPIVRLLVRGDLTPRQQAELTRLTMGLTTKQKQAVATRYGRMLDQIERGQTGRIISQSSGAARRRAIAARQAAGTVTETTRTVVFAATNEAEALDAARRYADKLRKYRASTIARTEVQQAAHRGLQAGWEQDLADGTFAEWEVERMWITTQDDWACPICKPMHKQRRGLREPFVTPSGATVMTPPAHPACRCSMGLVEKRMTQAQIAALRRRRAA